MIEKYFIITNEDFIKRYKIWKKNLKKFDLCFTKLSEEFGIESTIFYTHTDKLVIQTTTSDYTKFKDSILKNSKSDFKKASNESKRWIELINENGVVFLRKPSIVDLMGWDIGKSASNSFMVDDVMYGYHEKEREFPLPEGTTEIKASQYYKVIEDYNEKIKSKVVE